MGFTTAVMDPQYKAITMTRDGITIGLAQNGGDPEQASCYIDVTDVDNARAELAANYVNVSEIRIDNYGGARAIQFGVSLSQLFRHRFQFCVQ